MLHGCNGMRSFIRAIFRFFREADILLLVLSIICAVFGIVTISSILRNSEKGYGELYVQIGALVIGVALFILFSYIDIDIIADKSWLLMIFSVLFILTLIPWGYGTEEVGNKSWLRFFGVGIQPSEVVKVTFIIIIARMMANYRERKSLNSFLSILQIFLVFGVLFFLIVYVSADLGSAVVYIFILITMMFIGGVKLRWFALSAGVVAALSPLLWFNFMQDYQRNRIVAPFLPDTLAPEVLDEIMWHARQSVKAISSGEVLGQGLGNGYMTQRHLIPAQHTDFIFSAIGEEMGFIGCMLVVVLLVVIIARCMNAGIKSNNPLGLLVCTGIAAMLIMQTLENIGMCLGILPVIGITLPFFSYGGSSIVTFFAAMGIVSGIKMRPKPVRFRTI